LLVGRRALRVGRSFGEDTLSYSPNDWMPTPTRQAAAQVVARAKRNIALDRVAFIGLTICGITAGR
jgi:hypothetical protein